MADELPVFYDALVYLGRSFNLPAWQWSDVDSLGTMFDKYRISKALVASYVARDQEIEYGNELVFEAARKDGRLVPCPVVVPNSGLEVGDESDFIDGLIRRGARCVCFYPNSHGTTLDRRVIGELFAALEQRRMPVSLAETDILRAANLACEYPGIPFIVHRPDYRNRHVLPIVRQTPNLYVSIAPNFAPYGGIEVLVREWGADKLIFASAYPECEPGAPVSYLLYADIDRADAEKIAWGNLARLMKGVRSGDETSDHTARPALASPAMEVKADETLNDTWHAEPLRWEGIVDMHAHYGKFAPFPLWGGWADDLVQAMDKLGVKKMFVSHENVMGTEPVHGNDQVLEAMERYPDRIMGYATCYPVNDELGIDEIRRCLDGGMHGIKMHNRTGIPYTSDQYTPVWELANDRGLPVLLHTWGDLNQLDSIFDRYRKAVILLGHSGCVNAQMYVEYARRYPDIYLETCFSMSPYGLIEYFVREVGAERIVWGSDAPWYSMESQLARIIFAEISEEEKKLILVENPKRILGQHEDN